MDWNEAFSAVLPGNTFGLLLVELRTLLDVSLASGGLEVSAQQLAAYGDVRGAPLHLDGDVVEVCGASRFGAHNSLSVPG